jgi:DNA-binding transcriptional regulator YhcF (GntR family)
LLSFVPVTFDLYRPLTPRLRWAMQCLVSFADHAGRCFPSVRRFAVHAGISKSAAQRDLAELVDLGLASRKRRPGHGYVYRVARRFLPKWAAEQVSQHRVRKREAQRARQAERAATGVPERGTEEKPIKKNHGEDARAHASFGKSEVTGGAYYFDRVAGQWKARVEGWVRSGRRFWLAEWGPRPNEHGCLAPVPLLATFGLGSPQ